MRLHVPLLLLATALGAVASPVPKEHNLNARGVHHAKRSITEDQPSIIPQPLAMQEQPLWTKILAKVVEGAREANVQAKRRRRRGPHP